MPWETFTLTESLPIVALVIWFVISLVTQFMPTRWRRARHTMWFCFFPVWRLFAPEPVNCDFHILCRRWREGEGFEPWTEIPVIQPRTTAKTFFHPDWYVEKTVLTIIPRLIDDYLASPDVSGSLAYQSLLRMVHRKSGVSQDEGLQFAVVESFGYQPAREPMLVFASPVAQGGTL